jgi:hypothetical protein
MIKIYPAHYLIHNIHSFKKTQSQSNQNKMEKVNTPQIINNIMAILTIHTDNLPNNFQEIIKHEQEVLAQWKDNDIVEHLFLRQTKNGAIIVFKNIDEAKAKELMETLPLYKFVKSIEYFQLMKQY